MTASARTSHVLSEPGTESSAVAQRYEVAIGGAYNRTISSAAAESTFLRWREQPDVLMHGDMQTGFFWQWPDPRRTRITVTPVVNEPAVGANAGSSRKSAAPHSLPGEPR